MRRSTFRTVGRDLGRMLQALAGMMLLSLLVPIVWQEYWTIPGLLVSAAVPFLVGTGLATRLEDASPPGKLHGMMIAASGWFVVAILGSLPFLTIAWTVELAPAALSIPRSVDTATLGAFRHPLNGIFESMSGFTGTGLTMTDDESVLPHTLQWWRSFTEWVGGVGVIVLTTAILARPGSGSLTLYESEARSEKIHPSIVSTVRTIWWIFLLFTFVSILLLWLAGMPIWDAINHAMTGLATGGFSITDGSIGTYDSVTIDAALIPVMILGSIAFPIHYLVIRGDLSKLYTDLQTRWVFGLFGAGSLVLSVLLVSNATYPGSRPVGAFGLTLRDAPVTVAGFQLVDSAAGAFQAIRYGVFQFVSAASCTGFQTATGLGHTWSPEAQLTVAVGMVVGAAAGSTVGGIKLIRVATLARGIDFRIRNVFYPDSAVRTFTLGDRTMTADEASQEFDEAAIIATLWFFFLAVGGFLLLVVLPTESGRVTLANVIFEVASAQGNVGLSSGITGPSMPTLAKVVFLFNMWTGRLEIIPVLVLLLGIFVRSGVYR